MNGFGCWDSKNAASYRFRFAKYVCPGSVGQPILGMEDGVGIRAHCGPLVSFFIVDGPNLQRLAWGDFKC